MSRHSPEIRLCGSVKDELQRLSQREAPASLEQPFGKPLFVVCEGHPIKVIYCQRVFQTAAAAKAFWRTFETARTPQASVRIQSGLPTTIVFIIKWIPEDLFSLLKRNIRAVISRNPKVIQLLFKSNQPPQTPKMFSVPSHSTKQTDGILLTGGQNGDELNGLTTDKDRPPESSVGKRIQVGLWRRQEND